MPLRTQMITDETRHRWPLVSRSPEELARGGALVIPQLVAALSSNAFAVEPQPYGDVFVDSPYVWETSGSVTYWAREVAAQALVLIGAPASSAVPALLACWRSPDRRGPRAWVSEALLALTPHGPRDVAAAVVEALAGDHEAATRCRVASHAVRVLAPEQARLFVRRLLDDHDDRVRLSALDALVELRAPDLASDLVRLASDTVSQLRCRAVAALTRLAGPDLGRVLDAALVDDTIHVQLEAVRSLLSLGPQAVPRLLLARQSRFAPVRVAATVGLRAVGRTDLAVDAALEDLSAREFEASVEVLVACGSEAARAVEPIAALLCRELLAQRPGHPPTAASLNARTFLALVGGLRALVPFASATDQSAARRALLLVLSIDYTCYERAEVAQLAEDAADLLGAHQPHADLDRAVVQHALAAMPRIARIRAPLAIVRSMVGDVALLPHLLQLLDADDWTTCASAAHLAGEMTPHAASLVPKLQQCIERLSSAGNQNRYAELGAARAFAAASDAICKLAGERPGLPPE